MKRTLTGVIVVSLLFSSAALSSPLTTWGVKTGYTAATQVWEHEWINEDDISWRSGFHAGLFAEWFDFRGLSIRTGVTYEQKGMGFEIILWESPSSFPGEKETWYSLYHYLSITALGKYSFTLGPIDPYLLAGPRVDIFLGYAEDYDHLYWGIEDEFKDAVVGLSAGFGIENSTLISRSLFMEFVYNYDPMWLYEFTLELTGEEARLKNQSYNISIGIGF